MKPFVSENYGPINLQVIRTTYKKFINYCFCISNNLSKKAILIDPSWEKEKFDAYLHDNNLELAAILLTHHHLDHSHLASQLAESYDCEVYISRREVEFYNFQCLNLVLLDNNQKVLRIKDIINLQLVHTPGHTVGSICYLTQQWIFTGDTLFIEGCGTCSAHGGSAEELFNSLQKLKSTINPLTKVYPGHMFTYKIGTAFDFVIKNNIYLNISNIEDFINFRNRPNNTKNLSFK